MAFERFSIAPFNTGLETDTRPWLIMDDAFEMLQNAYVFRGRVRKRFGSILSGANQNVLQSRLAVQIGTTAAVTGNLASTIIPNVVITTRINKIGMAFSIGTTVFTVISIAAGAQVMLTTGAATGTYNVTTSAVIITGNNENPLTPVYWYPAEPVMGLTQYEIGAINNHPAFAFDTQYAYTYAGGMWIRSSSLNTYPVTPIPIPIFHGNNSNYFWATNWFSVTDNLVAMFVSNFQIANPNGLGTVTDDPIWEYVTPTWAPLSYSPDININYDNTQPLTVTMTTPGNNQIIANFVQSALIIVPFKNRLVMLNTIENNANGAIAYNPADHGTKIASGITPATYITSTNMQYGNRARFSKNGAPDAVDSWLEPGQTYNPGATGVVFGVGGDFTDASTQESIVSAEFIKDRLIVYFERSTWELAYTDNEAAPFKWQQLNTELGSQSTYSTVPFDKQILTIGNTGIHSCNGSNVSRIDEKIPDEVFDFKLKDNATVRTAGIRDYFTELVYWAVCFENETSTQTFPNQVLVYNYQNGAWAFNNDCITAFGYFEQQADDTWASTIQQWQEANWTWNSGVVAADFRQITAGTPDGFVLLLAPEVSRNAPSMQVTQIVIGAGGLVTLTIVDHNIAIGDCIALENLNGIGLPILGFYIVNSIVDKDNVTIIAPDIAGVYTGGGTMARVSNIQILSKQWNPYVSKDRNFYLARIDFGVQKTTNGQITVDYYPSYTTVSMVQDGIASGAIMGTGVLETSPYPLVPLESSANQLWHPLYFQTQGESVQIYMYFTTTNTEIDDVIYPPQITNGNIAWSDFELQGMILHVQPTNQRLQ